MEGVPEVPAGTAEPMSHLLVGGHLQKHTSSQAILDPLYALFGSGCLLARPLQSKLRQACACMVAMPSPDHLIPLPTMSGAACNPQQATAARGQNSSDL